MKILWRSKKGITFAVHSLIMTSEKLGNSRAYNSYIFNTLIGYRFYPFKEKKSYFKVFLNVPIIGLLKERIEFYTLVLIKDDHISTPFGVSFGF